MMQNSADKYIIIGKLEKENEGLKAAGEHISSKLSHWKKKM